ncbi:carboxymuconolactone decarboxylase family protein [Achromobacter sp. LC458]|uniref:carboxymuconolactone decarboxylase family protein n=1 Tax=Achromobacter sp. LC458 TaxID=1120623 RepID=UPI00062A3742|nr:carboxymuconolactone decarboxylase family protein [Achromobacter sp. LC458]TRM51154.1 carboxymuconolactone decarboxylase family protein [Achromobacter sp. LC458]
MHALNDPAAIKARFIAARGYWRPWTEALLHANPAFLSTYAEYAGYPARTGPLTPRMVELIYVALDTSPTHLYEAGLTTHLKLALAAGASEADVFDVLHLVTLQGLVAVLQAADVLDEAAPSAALPPDDQLAARIQALWPDQAASLLRLAAQDPGYVAVLLDFVEGGAPAGGLSHAERLLVRIALHAAFTEGNRSALQALIPHALTQGVTRAEILQVIQLGAHLAVHGASLGATVYTKVVADNRNGPGKADARA